MELHPSDTEEKQEREALGRIVLAFRHYNSFGEFEIERWRSNFEKLPERHKHLLHEAQHSKFAAAKKALKSNQAFLTSMLNSFDDEEECPPHLARANEAGDHADKYLHHKVSYAEADKIKYVLKNLVRDWSKEGASERIACYGPILEELRLLYGDWTSSGPHQEEEEPPKILLPGAGLARLCCEVAALGYQAQGNEFSYHMLLTSSFMLNIVSEPDEFTIHPWLLSNCNQMSDEDQLRSVTLPDIPPSTIVQGPGLLSMCAGDFVEVYSRHENKGAFDAVVTCFFIDTAHNVIEYLEIIHSCLKPGGHWINLGPLLYHWAETGGDDVSIELSLSEIKRVGEQLGLRLVRERMVDAPYNANIRSMYKTIYQACCWTMVKEGSMAPPPPPPPK